MSNDRYAHLTRGMSKWHEIARNVETDHIILFTTRARDEAEVAQKTGYHLMTRMHSQVGQFITLSTFKCEPGHNCTYGENTTEIVIG